MATAWWASTLPASEASAPFGMRMATGGVCSNESGIDSRRTFMDHAPFATKSGSGLAAPGSVGR
jgi:hypothetical protein